MGVVGYIITVLIIIGIIKFVVFMILVNNNGEQTSRFQDHSHCKGIAKKVWDDVYNNDTLTFNTFEEYWEWLVEKHKLN